MNNEQNDRLTSLPRKILINILSFLPTNFAVATAILSRTYRHLWTNITTLRFTITDFPEQKFKAIFFIILRRVSWRHINAIELTIDAHPKARYPSSLANLIHDIIYNGTNNKAFKVCFENFGKSTISLPNSVLKKQSLEVLEVYATHGVPLGDGVQFHHNKYPNLRKLVISLRECDLKLFENIANCCPLLELLSVVVKNLTKFKGSIKINARNLKYLSMNWVCEENAIDKNNKIMIDTQKLKYFEVHSPYMVKFCFLKTPSDLLKAKLFMGDGHESIYRYSKHVLSVLNPILRVQTLKLSGDLLIALSNLNVLVEVFHKLSHLEVGLSCSLSWQAVKYFLGKCPNVECLVLKRIGRAQWNHIHWPDFELLPCCLHNKIQRIELRDFLGNTPDLLLLRYIFGVAKDLKMFYITIQKVEDDDDDHELNKFIIVNELSKLSKELPTCEINFCDERGFRNGKTQWSTC